MGRDPYPQAGNAGRSRTEGRCRHSPGQAGRLSITGRGSRRQNQRLYPDLRHHPASAQRPAATGDPAPVARHRYDARVDPYFGRYRFASPE